MSMIDELFLVDLWAPDEDLEYGTGFVKDPLYYHKPLVYNNIIVETELAILFDDDDGQFWCPKKLIADLGNGRMLVHKCYKKTYITNDNNNDNNNTNEI